MRALALPLAALALAAAGPPTWLIFRAHGISVRHPPGWHATARPLTPVGAPRQVMAIASYPFPRDPRPNGCSPTGTLAEMPPGGALIFAIEYEGGVRSRDFPPRPRRFRLRGFAH